MITVNRHHYHPAIQNKLRLVVPDIAVFKDIPIQAEEQFWLSSWDMRQPGRPAPPVIFEIASGGTWPEDVEITRKPAVYGRIGVKEYFAYDPNEPSLWKSNQGSTCARVALSCR